MHCFFLLMGIVGDLDGGGWLAYPGIFSSWKRPT